MKPKLTSVFKDAQLAFSFPRYFSRQLNIILFKSPMILAISDSLFALNAS